MTRAGPDRLVSYSVEGRLSAGLLICTRSSGKIGAAERRYEEGGRHNRWQSAGRGERCDAAAGASTRRRYAVNTNGESGGRGELFGRVARGGGGGCAVATTVRIWGRWPAWLGCGLLEVGVGRRGWRRERSEVEEAQLQPTVSFFQDGRTQLSMPRLSARLNAG